MSALNVRSTVQAQSAVTFPVIPLLVVRAILQKRVDIVVATFTVIEAFLAILDCR